MKDICTCKCVTYGIVLWNICINTVHYHRKHRMQWNMSCCTVNSFDFAREKLHECFSASAVCPVQNRTNKQNKKTCFALFKHLLSIRTTTSWKFLMNNKFKAQTLTGNPTGNLCCHVLASRDFNMSCSFDQSACSIESRCVINPSFVECKWRRGSYLCSTQRDPCIKTLTTLSHIITPGVIILIYCFVYRIRRTFSYCVNVTCWYIERLLT